MILYDEQFYETDKRKISSQLTKQKFASRCGMIQRKGERCIDMWSDSTAVSLITQKWYLTHIWINNLQYS